MKSRLLTQPVLWTILSGVVVGGLGYGLAVRGPELGTNSLSRPVQALPVASNDVSKVEIPMSLKAVDEATSDLAGFALPAVVYIATSNPTHDPSQPRNLMLDEAQEAAGSGVIIRPDGYILTNDHVVAGFDKVRVTLKDGRTFDGEVHRAPDGDLAVVHINAKDLPSLAFADSDQVKPGQLAMAIGAPFNLPFSVTFGHVSAVGRSNEITDERTGTERKYTSLIQTDAAINRGNSGGPLIDMNGNIIGINTTIYSQSGGSNGIGFAIPANEARLIAEKLIAGQPVRRSAMGFYPSDIPEYLKSSLKASSGAYIQDVQSNGPAATAGLQKGDVVTQVGSTPVTDEADLRNTMLQYAPGSTVDIKYLRGGVEGATKIKLVDIASLEKQTPAAAPAPDGQGHMPNEDQLRKLFDNPDGSTVPPDGFRQFFHSMVPDGGSQTHADRTIGQPAHLGVTVGDLTADNRAQLHIPEGVQGALVTAVEPDSIADSLGMRPGTVVTKLGSVTVKTATDLVNAMKAVKWGDSSHVVFSTYGDGSVVSESADVSFR